MRLSVIFLLIAGVSVSCHNDEPHPAVEKKASVCDVDDPADLPWLKATTDAVNKTEFAKYSYLTRAEYKGATVFIFMSCCPTCLSTYYLQDCYAAEIKDVDWTLVENEKVIWRGKGFECQI